MTLKILSINGVLIYNFFDDEVNNDHSKEYPDDYLNRKNDYQNFNIIDGLSFDNSCQNLKMTDNEKYIIASGNYPPQILDTDHSKLVFLCEDNSLSLHNNIGKYYEIQMPKNSFNICYLDYMAQLLIVGDKFEINRFDLCEGKFCLPIKTMSEEINICENNKVFNLIGCAGDDGILEFFDIRQKKSIDYIDIDKEFSKHEKRLTSFCFNANGIEFAVGTSQGIVSIFDLRSKHPFAIKDHMYDMKINDIKFVNIPCLSSTKSRKFVVSADDLVIKIWDFDTGKTYTNIESKLMKIYSIHYFEGSGLFFAAGDMPKIQSYFIPSLGPAPGWCSFLENITEELELQQGQHLYDEYRFISQHDIKLFQISHLIGTSLLKAYMHGYLINNNLYKKIRLGYNDHNASD